MEQIVPWPVSLGIAASSVGALISVLIWLIRRQTSGHWYTAEQVTKLLTEKDNTLSVYKTLADDWKAAHVALAAVHTETAATLKESVDANRYIEMLFEQRPATPQRGHNGDTTKGAQS